MSSASRSMLSVPQQRLVLLMQAVNFGEIRSLHVKDGQPIFRPRPEIVRCLRLGADNSPRPETGMTDCALKKPVCDLLDELMRLGDGCVQRIGVKAGLPTDITLTGGLFDEVLS